MHFNKTTSYALSVLSYMAKNNKIHHSAKHLHEALEIPWPYLRQLLTNLSKSGFIKSIQGRSGGFQLRKPADQIYLAKIIDAVEGLDTFNTCIMGFKTCPFEYQCVMHEVWTEARTTILDKLHETNLNDLIRN
jgi:Rrf2 family protein